MRRNGKNNNKQRKVFHKKGKEKIRKALQKERVKKQEF